MEHGSRIGLQISVGRLPGQRGRRPLECPTAASRHRLSGCPPAAPAEENSSPTTFDSRACRGCRRARASNSCNRLSIYSSRSLVGLHMLEGLPDFPLRDVERLCLVHRAPPVTGWPLPRAEQRSPFGPAPLQNLRPYYELLRPCAPHRYSEPRGVRPLGSSPFASERQVLTFHTRACSSFAPPTCRMPLGPVFRTPPALIPE